MCTIIIMHNSISDLFMFIKSRQIGIVWLFICNNNISTDYIFQNKPILPNEPTIGGDTCLCSVITYKVIINKLL